MAPFYQSERLTPSRISPLPIPEPMICCLDKNCPNHFGPASECLLLNLREREYQQHLDPEDGSNEWIEDLSSPSPNIDITDQIFFDSISNSTVTKEDDLLTQDGYDADVDSETRSFDTISPYRSNDNLTSSSIYPSSTITSQTSQPPQPILQTSSSQSLEPWLSTLYHKTPAGRMTGITFEGGAEEQNREEHDCPFCSMTIGDLTDQHLLRCRYAHEEREGEERMAWLLMRGRMLRGRKERRSEDIRLSSASR
jgi:hypothetical protein